MGGYKGIITAKHVWEEAKDHQLLLVLFGRGNYAFETKYLHGVELESKTVLGEFDNVRVPDIAFITLPFNYVSDLEVKGKAFFNVDKRILAGSYLPEASEGYWTIFGNPYEWLETDKKKVISFVFGTGVSRYFESDSCDYFVMSLDTAANPDIPRDFSGMSGGGIWWAKWGCDEELKRFIVKDASKDMLLVGVSFFQTGPHNRMLVGHGPKSLYEMLYQAVVRAT